MVLNIVCAVAVAAVLVTKAADLWTTWKHVTAETETNPIGRYLFRRVGMVGGLVIVGVTSLSIVAATWTVAVALGPVAMVLAAVLSLFVSVVQACVAMHNATGRPNLVTRKVAALHRRWTALLLRRYR
jgi:uncharacterized protein YacL